MVIDLYYRCQEKLAADCKIPDENKPLNFFVESRK